jgi:hypothetical protein
MNSEHVLYKELIMRMSTAFPSAYIKAVDLFDAHQQPRRVKLKMNRVEMEDVGDDNKPVVQFIGTDKKLVLNKTNTSEIVDAYGDESDNWHGKIIEVYPARVEYAGKKMWGIRVNAMFENAALPAAAQAPLPPPPAKTSPPVNGLSDFPGDRVPDHVPMAPPPFHDDEIPF